jgi:phosphohistidine phosphatase
MYQSEITSYPLVIILFFNPKYQVINKNMYLYLIRHGIAVDPDPLVLDSITSDMLRPLTKKGRKKVEQVADKLKKLEIQFDLIMTSPLVRAQQTAKILIDRQISPKLEVNQDLKPSASIQSWLTGWNARTDGVLLSKLALIGHEPHLSEWAELLMFDRVYHQLILKKGGIIGLKFPDQRIEIGMAQLYCLIPPKILLSAA